MPEKTYPMGIELIEAGRCPLGARFPMACMTCQVGHMTECHHPMNCEEAGCSHLKETTDDLEFSEDADQT